MRSVTRIRYRFCDRYLACFTCGVMLPSCCYCHLMALVPALVIFCRCVNMLLGPLFRFILANGNFYIEAFITCNPCCVSLVSTHRGPSRAGFNWEC